MEQLAVQSGDVEKRVQVLSRDLSHAYLYLKIAELYRKAKKSDEALEWAEKGVAAFPVHTDSRLREFLANEYHSRGRHDEAMQIMWEDFSDYGGLEQYRQLKAHAIKTGDPQSWMQWREKALLSIKANIASARKGQAPNLPSWLASRERLARIPYAAQCDSRIHEHVVAGRGRRAATDAEAASRARRFQLTTSTVDHQ